MVDIMSNEKYIDVQEIFRTDLIRLTQMAKNNGIHILIHRNRFIIECAEELINFLKTILNNYDEINIIKEKFKEQKIIEFNICNHTLHITFTELDKKEDIAIDFLNLG